MMYKVFSQISNSQPARVPSLARVLGIDPGLTRCGFAVIESGPSALAFDVIRTPSDWGSPDRILHIASEIESVISHWQPELVAIEEVFAQQNLRSVMSVAQISGALMFLAKRLGLQVQLVTPTAVKLAVTGSGAAAKPEVSNMVTRHFKLKEQPKPADVSDALAIAFTALQRLSTPALQRWVEAERNSKR